MIKRTLLLSLLLASGSIQAQDPAATVVKSTPDLSICATCHGADGNNWVEKEGGVFAKTDGGADSPKLAGQHVEYLYKQMREFKKKPPVRANAVMNGMIDLLTDDALKAAAEFYAAQKLLPAEADGKDAGMVATGAKIWRAGVASKGVPACASCHGPAGKGMSAQYPALTGQFSNYIETQMKAFRDGVRSNDPAKMMRDIALKMTDPEIKAVANYAAGLR
jgi:cytochrome c553